MATNKIAKRTGTAAGWSSANPVLDAGELVYETDTKRWKIGDGATAYNSLEYAPPIIRRDTAANWTSADPTLVAGEFALETDSHKLKNGDGATAYTSLGYLRPINAVTVTGNHTVGANEDVVNVNAASATITLPAADVIGRRVTVRKVSASAGTVSTQRAGTDTIDGGTAAKALKAQFGSATFEVVASGSWSMVHRYEEGTWAPYLGSLAGSTPTAVGTVTLNNEANYTLSGSLLTCGSYLSINVAGSSAETVYIFGFPYENSDSYGIVNIPYFGNLVSAVNSLAATVEPDSTNAIFRASFTDSVSTTSPSYNTLFAGPTDFIFEASYFTSE